MSTAAIATAAPAAREATTVTAKTPRYPQIPARAGNANVRASLAQGIHPATRQPLTTDPGATCGTCVLSYRIQLPVPGSESTVRQHGKCSQAPISRRGHQGIDLRPETPACTLHCSYTDWPFDPDGHDQSADDTLGYGQEHPDEHGEYAVYRIFGIDREAQRVWVELISTMTPHTNALGAHLSRLPHRSKPDQPHRFWTELSRLHSAVAYHSADAGFCTHQLVRNGRVLHGGPGL
ncbi:hypothetical protein AB0B04_18925 [Streptomyces xinghaiensis]|uniref:Uncharacterized protein n=2 Tax=Streptomyces TaxID=1883 RepID=A0A3R7F808_9ACTN|nr:MULTISPECIES: hypothetical protein [Streptomyces]KNE78788.1 hypothetical protein ADZ36_31245 [Streptomyces fradiae]OFA36647.1 hypothetical protein BEN35_29770 [Streptomyces fradiae]PQM20644.1 hypothetical protein Sfr7A_26015 [Streptomyces xinghaiensis]RKM92584.1 hypothetical protein SFRA_024670 [Streptomyces xinghaiensis]RNC70552.1 hypothetical protein DC095_025660 [Streptomyces xinghaiensis]